MWFSDFKNAIDLLRTSSGVNGPGKPMPVVFKAGERELVADLYLPPRKSGPGVLLVHGFSAQGAREDRLKRLATGLCRAGFVVLAPTFPDPCGLRITTNTIEEVTAATLFLGARPEVEADRMGIFGISYGATLALLSVSRPPVQNAVRWVACFGGYASLENVITFAFKGKYPKNGTMFPVAPDGYIREILEKNFGVIDPNYLDAWLVQHAALIDSLSIDKKLDLDPGLKVILAHSKHDSLIPWLEMKRMRDQLRKAGVHVKSFRLPMQEHARLTHPFASLAYLRFALEIVKMVRLKY